MLSIVFLIKDVRTLFKEINIIYTAKLNLIIKLGTYNGI